MHRIRVSLRSKGTVATCKNPSPPCFTFDPLECHFPRVKENIEFFFTSGDLKDTGPHRKRSPSPLGPVLLLLEVSSFLQETVEWDPERKVSQALGIPVPLILSAVCHEAGEHLSYAVLPNNGNPRGRVGFRCFFLPTECENEEIMITSASLLGFRTLSQLSVAVLFVATPLTTTCARSFCSSPFVLFVKLTNSIDGSYTQIRRCFSRLPQLVIDRQYR